MRFEPAIDPAIWAIAPGFRALSLVARRPPHAVVRGDGANAALAEAVGAVQAGGPPWATPHLSAWDDVFRRFGAKPQRTSSSAAAMRERVLKTGTLPSIDPVVDLYNAVSLKFAVPVGGENIAAYRGNPRLVVATGEEVFDAVKNGAPATENPEKGEVVWRDDLGVTCRRWNWRQGVRTRINTHVTEMWFVLESLPEMPLNALEQAGDVLARGLHDLFGEVSLSRKMLKQE